MGSSHDLHRLTLRSRVGHIPSILLVVPAWPKDEDKTRSTAEAKQEDEVRHVSMIKMADKTGCVVVVSEEDEAQHLIVAILAIVAKEVNKTTRRKDSGLYSRMSLRV